MRRNSVKFGFSGLLLTAGLGLLVGACERHENAEPKQFKDDRPVAQQGVKPTPDQGLEAAKGERAQALGSAVDTIASARCDRELRCNNVGSGKRYESKDACMSAIRNNQRQDLNLTACPGGVNEKELNECLQEITKDDCNNPLDNITRIAACRTDDICRG
jgi:hypothetical protein